MAIGGAPISQMYADEIGADGYGSDASSAGDLFVRLVGKDDRKIGMALFQIFTGKTFLLR